jgi:predicted MPP superfamily phosphohydrolase
MRIDRKLTRRGFLALSGAAAVAGGLGLYAWRVEPHWVRVVRRDMPVGGLPAELHGRRVVQISDLHVGHVVDSNYLIRCMRLVSDLGPDLTVVTGDFINRDAPGHVDEAARVLGHLRPGPLGCLAVLGNHDYGIGWSNADVAGQLCRRLDAVGVTVLRNQARDVAGLQVVGLEDLWGPFFRPEPVMRSLDPGRPALALCHNPDAVDLPIWSGFRGWVLSGHTHGGQCKPPFLPPPILPVKNTRYTAGAFDLPGGRWLYINPGLGYLRRVRFNVRPEITVFRLIEA